MDVPLPILLGAIGILSLVLLCALLGLTARRSLTVEDVLGVAAAERLDLRPGAVWLEEPALPSHSAERLPLVRRPNVRVGLGLLADGRLLVVRVMGDCIAARTLAADHCRGLEGLVRDGHGMVGIDSPDLGFPGSRSRFASAPARPRPGPAGG